MTEQDWRGILAVLTTVGYFAIVSLTTIRYDFLQAITTAAILSTPLMLVLNWYFKAQEEAK